MFVTLSPIRTPNVHPVERIASVVGGGLLALSGIRNWSGKGGAMALAGAEMIRRGITGKCYIYQTLGVRTASPGQGADTTSVPYELGIHVRETITIYKPRPEVYRFWRAFTNLPRFMRHLKSVEHTGLNRTHWVAEGPAGIPVEWDAEIVNEVENEVIGWRSLEGSTVDSAGSVNFKDAPGGRGTELLVELQYNPPAGAVGALVAKMFARDPKAEIEDDLGRLKQYLESGEIATTERQPKGANVSTEGRTADGKQDSPWMPGMENMPV